MLLALLLLMLDQTRADYIAPVPGLNSRDAAVSAGAADALLQMPQEAWDDPEFVRGMQRVLLDPSTNPDVTAVIALEASTAGHFDAVREPLKQLVFHARDPVAARQYAFALMVGIDHIGITPEDRNVIDALGYRQSNPAVVQRLAALPADVAKSSLSDFDKWLARGALEYARKRKEEE